MRVQAIVMSLGLILACAKSLPSEPSSRPKDLIGETSAVMEPSAVSVAPSPQRSEPADVLLDPGTRKAPTGGVAAPVPEFEPQFLSVGLETDLPQVELPCCPDNLVANVGGWQLGVVSGLKVEPGISVESPVVYRLQIAALRDERQAQSLARQVSEMLGEPADVVFNAGQGLYRVRVGSYSTRNGAESGRRQLAQRNVHGTWVTSEQPDLSAPSLKVTQERHQWVLQGRLLELRSPAGEGILVGGKRYRGDILVFLNDRGTLNLINRLSVDDYLRGVVPREMGPAVYDNLEALKAQAVAARTYTLRNMGEFGSEGYDICATPRCQVYGGMGAEHPLSNRAVLETSGEVLVHQGSLADALYSSSCGGHTEDVEVVFPLKRHAYLRGVPCLEAGVDRFGSAGKPGASLETEVMAQLFDRRVQVDLPGEFEALARELALLAGVQSSRGVLRSLDRREVRGYIASLLDLAAEARLFVANEELPYALELPPPGWTDEDVKLAAYFMQSGVLGGRLEGSLAPAEVDRTLLELAIFLRLVERERWVYLGAEKDRMKVRGMRGERAWELPEDLPTFRNSDGRLESVVVELVPGDRVTTYSASERLLVLVREAEGGVPHMSALAGLNRASRENRYRSWSYFRTDNEIAGLVEERYPELGFSGLEILSRGVSGRIAHLKLLGAGGKTEDLAGLPIRWTLDLPDTLFTAERLSPRNGKPGWRFTGRGWGHGVGMCQVGAYGMSLRGRSYREILDHYYTGLEFHTLPVANSPKLAAR